MAERKHGSAIVSQRQLRQMAAGGGAGIVAKTVVAPFERVKIVCQTGESVGMVETTVVRTGLLRETRPSLTILLLD